MMQERKLVNLTSPSTGGFSKWNDHDKPREQVKAVRCAKCGKEILPGQVVKKGVLRRKSFHRECVS